MVVSDYSFSRFIRLLKLSAGLLALVALAWFLTRSPSAYGMEPLSSPQLNVDMSPLGPLSDTGSMEQGTEIAIDQQGSIYTIWVEDISYVTSTPASRIYVRQRTRDGHWLPKEAINSHAEPAVRFPQLAVDAAGNMYALWLEDENAFDAMSQYRVMFNEKLVDGNWGTPYELTCATTESCNLHNNVEPDLAVSASGEVVAVWNTAYQGPASGSTYVNAAIVSRWRPRGQAWQPIELVNPGFAELHYSRKVSVGIDAAGNHYAIWDAFDMDDRYDRLFFSTRPVHGTWQAMKLTSGRAPTVYEIIPDLAVTSAGVVHAAWVGYDQEGPWPNSGQLHGHIFYSSRQPDGTWSAPTRINAGTNETTGPPDVFVDATNNVVVAWSEYSTVVHIRSRADNGEWSPPQSLSPHVMGGPKIAVDGNGYIYLTTRRYYPSVVFFTMSAPALPAAQTIAIETSPDALVTYQTRITNTLPFAATYEVVSSIPKNTGYRDGSFTASQGNVAVDGERLTWTGDIAPNQTLTASFQLMPHDSDGTAIAIVNETAAAVPPQSPIRLRGVAFVNPYQLFLPLAQR